MTDPALIERITRSLAFMLRHQPETFDLELDSHGFADLGDVVQALNERLGEPVEEADVRDAVTAGDRPRYEIQADRIRALYGHSIPVEPGPSSKPPEFLFVAVPESELERARRFGLRGGRRRFLHLAITKEDAAESGKRASRDYTVLVIHALDAWEEGISFYDRTALWLAEEIPTHLLEVEGTYHDGTEPEVRRFDGPREHGFRDRGQDNRQDHHGQGRGRGRRGRGRGGERHYEHREGRGGGERRGDSGRGAPAREPERSASFSGGDADRGRRPNGGYAREGGRGGGGGGGGDRAERAERTERAPRERDFGQSAPPREGGSDRGDGGRREGRREERRFDRPDEREPRRDERRGEQRRDEPRRDEPRRDEPRRDERPAREERRAEPRRAPAERGSGGGGFGAGLDSREERREREERPAPPPPPPPPPPPRREERPPVEGPRFGAGL